MKKPKIKTPKPVEKVQKEAQLEIAPKPVRNYRLILIRTYLIGAILSFLFLSVIASRLAYFPLDLTITRGIQTIHLPWFDTLMRLVTTIGYHPQMTILALLIALFLFIIGLWWEAVVGLIAWSGSSFLTSFIKSAISRPRPDFNLVHVVTRLHDPSFPSGHVLTYTVFFGYLWYLAFTLLKKSHLRTLLLTVTSVLVALVGPSRIYLGAHWASDTAGAYFLGSVVLLFLISFHREGKKRLFPKQPTAPEKKSV